MDGGRTGRSSSSSRSVIRRRRLLRLLDESPSRIITLVAPAGYGKTTLAHQWLEETASRATWYRATSSAGDAAATAMGVATAAGEIVPEAGASLRSRLRVSHSPADEPVVLAELLADDLEQWPQDAWLVIDDYQFIADEPAAEAFVETLLFSAPLNALIASRRRPSWATSRRLLYGETYEVGRSLLAMDSEEADAVMMGQSGASLPGLLALAEGWPAVIGLAALTRINHLPESQVPEHLFDFFAQELYRSLTPQARSGLSQMAAVARVDPAVAAVLLGSETGRVLSECWDAGLVMRRAGDVYEIHPLVRSFLDRAGTPGAQLAERTLEDLADLFIGRADWDEALGLTRRTARYETIEKIIAAVLDPLMNSGRLQTLEEVVSETRQRLVMAPILDLVEAEIAFRRARYDQAEALASRTALRLPRDHPSLSRALFRAGHASFFADRTKNALSYADESREAASDAADLTNALWLQFVGMTELEMSGSRDVLERLATAASDDPQDVVRVTTGQLIVADRWGRVRDALVAAEAAYWLLPQVADPMVRSSFYNMFGRVLIDSGEYARALEISQQGIDEIHKARLDFAFPHMLMPKSSAHLGLGQIASALETANTATRLTKDAHAAANCGLLRARVLITSREFTLARQCLAEHTGEAVDPATRGEILAYDAFAAACEGDLSATSSRIAEARAASTTVHTTVVGLLAEAIASASPAGKLKSAEDTFAVVSRTQHVDDVVLAARANEDFNRLLSEASLGTEPTIKRAHRLAQAPIARVDLRVESDLTPRETEVLELVSSGLSNREIAKRLFISEVTVKVHVRHILAKLGASSRTEAAVLHMKQKAGG